MTGPQFIPRKHLNADALIGKINAVFKDLPDPTGHTSGTSLADALMSGFAIYSLKDPSLLAFQARRNDENIKDIYRINYVPSDSHMRCMLDEVEPLSLGPAFRSLFSQLQRGKGLERYAFLDGSYLLLVDGVEYFRSKKIHCSKCLESHHANGTVSYYHQMLGAVIAHPDLAEVIPLMPEPIQKQDGSTKNDCELNAAKRLFERISKEHPHLRFIVTEDALSAAPHLRHVLSLGWHYLIAVKPKDHEELFAQVEAAVETGLIRTCQFRDAETGIIHCFRWLEQVALNKSSPDLLVNFLEYWEIGPDFQVRYYNSWVTELECHQGTVWQLMRGGRARWKVENETFNTLKNQGYHFEHNYGHGSTHLSVVMAMLMMLAFGVDQIQQFCNGLFQAAWGKCGSKRALWEEIRSVVQRLRVSSLWEVYEVVYRGNVKLPPVLLDGT